MHVTIAIPTRHRLPDLALLLDGPARQEGARDLSFEVLVVDNDPDGSARQTVATIRHGWVGAAREFVKGSVLLPMGLVLGTIALPLSRRKAAAWYMKAVCGIGKVTAALGHRFEMYANPPEPACNDAPAGHGR